MYINMSDISGEIYGYIRYIGRNISKDYSNRLGSVYWYINNKVYYLVDLDVQLVCLVILNHFGTAFVYTVIF